jgi:hypothetical protein
MSLGNVTQRSIGFTISEFAQETPRDLKNGLGENHSRWRVVLARAEVILNPDLTCAADPGSNLAGRQGVPLPAFRRLADLAARC